MAKSYDVIAERTLTDGNDTVNVGETYTVTDKKELEKLLASGSVRLAE